MVSIEKSKNGQFYARITGGNNEKLQRSETLKVKASAAKNLYATFLQLKEVFEGGGKIVDNTKPKKKKRVNYKTVKNK